MTVPLSASWNEPASKPLKIATGTASDGSIEFTITRKSTAEDCDYVLENMPSVGRHHCRILYKETTNNYYLEDLNSKNGTYVNTLRLVPNTPQLLQKGNMVTLDHYQFIFKPKG